MYVVNLWPLVGLLLRIYRVYLADGFGKGSLFFGLLAQAVSCKRIAHDSNGVAH